MAGEIHKVIQVELAAVGEAMGRVSRVSTCDGCGNKVYITAHIRQAPPPPGAPENTLADMKGAWMDGFPRDIEGAVLVWKT